MNRTKLTGGSIFVVLAVLIVFAGLPGTANAQSRAEINAKIEALEKQLQAVQRQVFDSDSPYFPDSDRPAFGTAQPSQSSGTGRPASMAGTDSATVLMADMAVKVAELENQLRLLTGQIEELQYQNRQLSDRLSRFEKDTVLRLNTLEGHDPALQSTANDLPPRAATDSTVSSPAGLVPTPSPEDAEALLQAQNRNETAVQSPPKSPEDAYEAAYNLLRRGQVSEAEQAFQAFLATHKSHSLAGNAQYWLGESYYVRQDYPRAAQAFLTGYQDYGDSGKAPDSLLKLGITLAALGQKEDACAAFDELDMRYPDAETRIKQRLSSERNRLGCS